MNINKKNFRYVFPVVTILLLLWLPSVSYAAGSLSRQKTDILVILSYDPSFPTSSDIMASLAVNFPPESYELHVQFMNTKRLPGATRVNLFRTELAYELSQTGKPDLVLTCDDNALHFAIDNRDLLFPAVPVVFAGVNDRSFAQSLNGAHGVTGVVESISAGETIALMKKLFPAMKTLTVIVDNTETGQADLKTIEALDLPVPLVILNISSMHEKDFLQRLVSNEPNNPLLLIGAYQGYGSKIYSFWESLALIRTYTASPLFHLWKHGVGNGLLGGKVVSHYEQIKTAAGQAKRILAGEEASRIPVVTESPNVPIFDWLELRKFRIKNTLLPPETIFIHKPASLYESHPNVYWSIIVASTAMLGLIATLSLIAHYRALMSIRLARNITFLRKLLDTVETPIYLKNEQGEYVMANTCFARLLGQKPEWVLGKHSSDIIDPVNSALLDDLDQQVIAQQTHVASDLSIQSEGKRLVFRVLKVPVEDIHGTRLILGSMQDLTAERMLTEQLQTENKRLDTMVADRTHQLEEANEKLAGMAQTDQLTKLANRRKLDSVLNEEVGVTQRYASPLSVIMLDMDHFKQINDQLGHPTGDEVLKAVSGILAKGSRSTDIAGRWGGEEFLIICRGTTLAGAAELAEKIRLEIEQSNILKERPVTASFGVCSCLQSDTPANLIQRADSLLYRAKSQGRNRVETAERA